jgi:hypothetical protein
VGWVRSTSARTDGNHQRNHRCQDPTTFDDLVTTTSEAITNAIELVRRRAVDP